MRPALNSTQVNAVRSLLMAKAGLAVMAERVAPIRAELMAVWKPQVREEFRDRRDQTAITDWKHLYLTDDATFADMMADKLRLESAAGIFPSKPGNCPYCEAEHLVTLAQHAVVLAFGSWGPMADKPVSVHSLLCHGMETYHKFIDLCCGLVASSPQHRKALAAV